MKRVLICDDEELIVDGIRRLLGTSCEIVGVVTTCSGLASVDESAIDLVLLDVGLRGGNALDSAAHLIKSGTDVVFMSGFVDNGVLGRCQAVGAAGLILKSDGIREILRCVDEKKPYYSPTVKAMVA